MNSKPTREATNPNIPKECSSQRLLESTGQHDDSQAIPLLCEEPSALSGGLFVDDIVVCLACSLDKSWLVGGSDSSFGVTGSLMLVSATSLESGEGDSNVEVALLARDRDRDDSKELDEELVLSEGVRSPDGVPGLDELDEAAGSTMIGFALI